MATKTEYYEVKEGQAVELPSVDIGKGRVAPTGTEILELPAKWGRRRIAIYPTNSPTPFPVGAPVTIGPRAFGVADLQNLIGPYISGLVKRALNLDETQIKVKDWIVIGLSGLSLAISGATLWIVVKLARLVGVL